MWSYDDYNWWANEVHYATCPAMRGRSRQEMAARCISDLRSKDLYQLTLDALSAEDFGLEDAAALLFRAKALRKWRLADPDLAATRRKEAIAGFLLRNADPSLECDIPYPYCVLMRDLLKRWLPEPTGTDLDLSPVTGRFGPGACAESWSHAKRFIRLAQWQDSSQHWPEDPHGLPDADHVTARLCAVPKQYDKDRLITVEPAYATFAQQAARSYILQSIHSGPLNRSAMDLGYVDGAVIQRRLALRASKNKRFATLDLSDASDSIGWHHVQQVFPAHILDWLWATRSTEFTYATDRSSATGTYHKVCPMRMFAGMGNATTFPIETLFFSAFVSSYARAHGLPTFVSVFGDDIICHSSTASELIKEKFSFFKINRTKSFLGDDKLRESCGIFAYQGEDITVPKVDGYPNSWDGRLGICDLHTRCRRSRFRFLQRLAYGIAATAQLPNLPHHIDGYPSICDEIFGAEAGWNVDAIQTRWNPRLYRTEIRVPCRHPIYSRYSLDWQQARRRNQPPPEVWLPGILLGQISTPDTPINGRTRCGPTCVRFPLEKSYAFGHRWAGISVTQ